MLNNIIKWSLNNKYLILLASVLLIVAGTRTALKMDVDVFPDLTAPTVVIMTDAHGMASEEVETLVTFPIETAVNGASGIRRVRSASMQGFSFVWAEFDWGKDILEARQIVSEKLMTITSKMPLGVGQPTLAPQSSVMGEIFFVGMQSESTSLMELRTIADWNIKPLILSTGGVSQVTIIGGDYKQYQVEIDPNLMKYYGVSVDELIETCKGISRNSAGGVLREYGNEFVIRGMARTADTESLGNTFIKSVNENPIKINDVAEVKIGSARKMGHASENSAPAVILSISKQPNANTLEVTEKIEQNLEEIQKTLPVDVKLDTHIFRQADFIETSISNVQRALIEGAIFVVIILFLFLGSFRTTIISLLAIPLSLLGSILVMKMLNININTMTLGGMAIAIGSLVDDAIIDVENVYKRLKQNRLLPEKEKKSSVSVVYDASVEIRSSILNATLIIMVAFLPLFFLSGMEGRMLQPLGIAFIVSLFVSLIVAMSLTPVLSNILLSNEKYLRKNSKEKWLVRTLSSAYQKSLALAIKHKIIVLSPIFALFIVSIFLFSSFGRSFLPEFNEGSLVLSVVTKPGTSLDVSSDLGNMVEDALHEVPEVTWTTRRTGRGELDEHSQSTNSAEIDVNFKLGERERSEFMADIRDKLTSVPGITYTVGQPLGHRIDHMLSGTRANIAIKLFGTDLDKMFRIGNDIKTSIEDIQGLVDVNVTQQIEVPQIQIQANRNMLAQYGISLNTFNEFIDNAFGGEKISDIYEGQRRFDLIIKLDDYYFNSLEGIKNTLISTESGKKVPLSDVAEIKSVTGPNSISRENVQRKIVVSANVADRDLRSVVSDIKNQIDNNIILPNGYRIEYGGQFESEEAASKTLLFTSIAAIIIIFLLLFQEFKNFKLAAIILLNLPLALIGGVFSIWITSGVLSIPAIIGFITLFGIATRNGILLISNYQRLLSQGVSLFETVTRGSADRLNAILMTALTAALALIPLALNGDLPGNEIQSPMAKVILGGLLSSTLLNIYVVPIVFCSFQNKSLTKIHESAVKTVSIVLIAVAISATAHAQTDVEQIVNDIEKNNPTLKAVEKEIEARQIENKTGIYLENPELEVSYLFGKPDELGERTDFSITQSFDFPTAYIHKSKIAELSNKQLEYEFKKQVRGIRLNAMQIAYDLIHINKRIVILEKRIENAKELAVAYKKKFDAGDCNIFEFTKAEINQLNVANEHDQLLIEKTAKISELISLNGGNSIEFNVSEYPTVKMVGNFSEYYDEIYKRIPELRQTEIAIMSAEKRITLNRALSMPSFSLGYKSESVLDEQFQGASVGVSIPLFENKNRINHAKAMLSAEQVKLESQELLIKNTLETLYYKSISLKQKHDEFNEKISLLNNESLLKKAHDAGEMSIVEYIMELAFYYDSFDRLLKMENEYQQAKIQLTIYR
jgi:CzcA family heavy metal efflux pump